MASKELSTVPAPPLRHRMVDALNDVLKARLGHLHPVAKAAFIGAGRLRGEPRGLRNLASALTQAYSKDGLSGVGQALWAHAAPSPEDTSYAGWVARYDTLNDEDVRAIEAAGKSLGHPPALSFFVDGTDALDGLIASLDAQVYRGFSLTVIVSAEHESLPSFPAFCQVQARRPGESFAQAFARCVAEVPQGFVGLLSTRSRLPRHALYWVAATLAKDPELKALYTDDDALDADGNRHAPFFKPDFDPVRLEDQFYLRGLAVYRTELAQRAGSPPRLQFIPSSGATPSTVGGNGSRGRTQPPRRSGPLSLVTGTQSTPENDQGHAGAPRELSPEGVAFWLALECTQKLAGDEVAHLPLILHHGVGGPLVPSDDEALEVLRQSRPEARVEPGPIPGTYQTRPVAAAWPLTSLIIPTRNAQGLVTKCVESILATAGKVPLEILLVDNGSNDPEALTSFRRLERSGTLRVLRDDGTFNFSRLNNRAVKEAKGAVLGLVNNDIEALKPGWLEELVTMALQPKVGAVGAKLYYPNGAIQHAGVVLGLMECVAHRDSGLPGNEPGHMNRLFVAQSASAVTAACLFLRRELYWEVAGLDEEHLPVSFNDVDLCLKLLARGYRNVWLPSVELLHHESISRGNDDPPAKQRRLKREVAYIRERWGALLKRDPYFNENLSLRSMVDALASPPRVTHPWRQPLEASP
jgi:GT2 family glycosyltransferase